MDVFTLIEQAGLYQIDSSRLDRARNEIIAKNGVAILAQTPAEIRAKVSGHYTAVITLQPALRLDCDCPDWMQNGRGRNRPCKHILATGLETTLPAGVPAMPTTSQPVSAAPPPAPTPTPAAPPPPISFAQKVKAAVARAVETLSVLVEASLAAGEIPFLIGPTGTGKTSAVRAVATRNGWGFEETGGAPSFADADLVGIKMQGGTTIQGIFARAFARARQGETVLLFLDEFLRLNQRAQDILMRPFLPTPTAIARAMGIPTNDDVRLIEAPLWGVEWAPADRVKIVLAANPWGSLIDPALIRRALPITVEFDQAVAALFDRPLRDAIQASWSAVQGGELPLPIEYGALCRAKDPTDQSLLTAYLTRLRAVDTAAAEGFKTVLEGMGIKP